ncbi:MAG: serine/threonine protein kinase [Bradymonadia bacterium]|jgi:serine/threonine protein kinase
MGEIWLARATGAAGWQKPVVVKRVLPHLEDDPEFLTRFIDEARISASLSHGNIVPVFDLGEDDGMYFIAMEWVDGWDLRKLLRILKSADERLPLRFALYVATGIADGLAYAHRQTDDAGVSLRIVHRDVSPSNVLISRSGEVKITDFGIASARERLGRTVTGQLRGKFAYMSPEQALGQPVDQRSDLFALGALLLEMIIGEKAFDGGSDMGTLEKVRRGERVISDTEIPAGLLAIIDRTLSVDPAARFDSAEDVSDALRSLLHQEDEPVTARGFARFLRETFESDPVLAAQAQLGGASLDAILNAQLDVNGTPTPSMTDSSRLLVPTASSNSARLRLVSPSGSAASHSLHSPHTMTHALAAPQKGRGRWAGAVALVLLLCVAAAWAFTTKAAQVTVETRPSGANVYVDGVLEGISNISARLTPGSHSVRLQLDGYDSLELQVAAERGQTVVLDETLRPSDIAIVFDSVPGGAVVAVGDEQIQGGNALTVPVGVPIEVRMELPGHQTYAEQHTFAVGDRILTRQLMAEVAALEPTQEPVEDEHARERSEQARDRRDTSERDERPERSAGSERAPDAGAIAPLTPDPDPEEVAPELERNARLRVRFAQLPGVGLITIDGRPMGTNSNVSETFSVVPGTHAVVVTNALGERYQASVSVPANESRTVNVMWRSE